MYHRQQEELGRHADFSDILLQVQEALIRKVRKSLRTGQRETQIVVSCATGINASVALCEILARVLEKNAWQRPCCQHLYLETMPQGVCFCQACCSNDNEASTEAVDIADSVWSAVCY